MCEGNEIQITLNKLQPQGLKLMIQCSLKQITYAYDLAQCFVFFPKTFLNKFILNSK